MQANQHGGCGFRHEYQFVTASITSPTGAIDNDDLISFRYGAQNCQCGLVWYQRVCDMRTCTASSVNSVQLYVDGVQRASCNSGGPCTTTLGTFSTGTHTFQSVSQTTETGCRKPRGRCGTVAGSCYNYVATQSSPLYSFSIGAACNSNGVCESGETSSSCSSDCLSDSGFSISIDPTKGLANKGDVKVTNTSLTLISGSGSAAFSATGIPAGTSIAFSPTSCTPTCYSNATITTTATTPEGSHLISIKATSGSVVKTATYNLTILGTSATCGNSVCEYPETQSTCASDCTTTTSIPSPVMPGETVTVMVEFYDFRYEANQPVKIDLTINPEGIAWTPLNGCFFGGKKMDNAAGGGAIAWPGGTVSENGHFKITTSCTLPGTIAAGSHTLVATPTIF